MAHGCTLVVAAAPLARRAADIGRALVEAGWLVHVIPTPNADSWLDHEAIEGVTGYPATPALRHHRMPKVDVPRDVVIVCPATLNTVSKAAVGIADTHAHSVIAEALGQRLSTLMVPLISDKLWEHPTLATHLDSLRDAGVRLLDPATGVLDEVKPVASGTGDAVADAFDPQWLVTWANTAVR